MARSAARCGYRRCRQFLRLAATGRPKSYCSDQHRLYEWRARRKDKEDDPGASS